MDAVRPSSGLALSFTEMTLRVAQLDQFYRQVMQEGTDYGKIPGTDKPTLYQPGAQMLDQIFGYVPTFEVASASTIDWQRPIPFFHYVIVCRLISRRTGEVVAEGIGSCNSHEDKYRWRSSKRRCPDCAAEAIIKGKAEYGGGWLCFKKNGGCGAKYRDGDQAIESQSAGRVENEDTASLENTVSKMAQKRAHIAATLNATGASRIFTQDIEDLPQFQQALVVESRATPATGLRDQWIEKLRSGTAAVRALGADVDDTDPTGLSVEEIKETAMALAGMLRDIQREQAKQSAPAPAPDDEMPF
jgi:hypothetical protein